MSTPAMEAPHHGDASTALEYASQLTVEADGYAVTREPRQMLMRRAITAQEISISVES